MSTDGTQNVVKKYADKVIVAKASIPEGRNLLLKDVFKNTNSEFIVFVNSDVILPKKWLKTAINLMKKNDECGAIGSFQLKPKNVFEKSVYYILAVPNPENFNGQLVSASNAPCEAVIYRKKALLNIFKKYHYFFDNRLVAGEDPEFSFRLIKIGWKIYLSKKLMIRHKLKSNLRPFWRMQKLYGVGLRGYRRTGVVFDIGSRVSQLLTDPIKYGVRERDPFLTLVCYFYLAVKLIANLIGFKSE